MTLLAAGCRKDNTIVGMRIVSEGMRSDNKAMIEGLNMTWVAGESIRINGEDKAIAVNDENQAYLENVTASDVYRAIYPSSLNSSATLDDDNVTVTIPSTHTYNSDANGNQLLDIPMAGRSESGSSLYLKHLTAAITVEITNYYGFAVLVDSVVVTSSDDGTPYQISGVTNINLNDANMGITTNSNPTEAQKKVKMIFDGTHPLKINQGATKKVQVPVLPVGSGNKFSISVTVHKDGDAAVTKTFTKTQGTGGAMGRAKMAYAGHTVGFTFSIATNKVVIFSQGNLRYLASAESKWSFAEEQYDHIGNAAGNNVFDDSRPTQSNPIDLFGWGTSGWNNGNANYMPYNNYYTSSNYGYGYGPKIGSNNYYLDLTGAYAEADWGIHNKIINGGNQEGLWRTLSITEWQYLLGTRSASSVNSTNNARYAKAKVNNIQGLIIFPDTYSQPNGITPPVGINSTSNDGWDGNNYNDGEWKKIEAMGAVFLPITGRTGNKTVENDEIAGYYWSSSQKVANNIGYAFIVLISPRDMDPTCSLPRYYGCSVRLVMDVR